jgi:predicted permease
MAAMLTPSLLLIRLRALLTRTRRDRALDNELAFHLEMETARLVADGVEPAEAHRRAVRDFGGVARYRDEARDARGISFVEDFITDFRVAVRGFRRTPGFAAITVLTLAVGIGATTAIFGTVHGVLLAPLPYDDPERIVVLWQNDLKAGEERQQSSPANFLDWRARNRSLEHVAAAEPFSFDYVGNDGPERFRASLVTEGFFDIFGLTPVVGRTFTAADYVTGAAPVVVLGEKLWRTRFGGDSSIIGRALVLDSVARTVVGIIPASFDLPHGESVWAPKAFREDERGLRAGSWYEVVGRIHAGTSIDAARTDMARVAADLAKEYPATNASIRVSVEPIGDALLGRVRGSLALLFGAVGFVLAIVCANVATLLIARTLQRERELAIRSAVGAGRERLVRQLFSESLVLAIAGGVLGVILAVAGVGAIRAIAPIDLPRVEEIKLSPAVLTFSLLVTMITALASGLASVAGQRHRAGFQLMSTGHRASATRRARRLRTLLVVTETALALVLMIGAGLLIRSFSTLLGVDRGFDSRNVLVTTVQTWGYYPTTALRAAYVLEATSRLRNLPGVRAVGTTSSLPLSAPIGLSQAQIVVEGQPAVATQEIPRIHVAAVNPAYFDVLRIPLRRGRLFLDTDNAGAAPVVIVNEAFARRYWPMGSALGKRVSFGFQSRAVVREIVGVVGDVRHRGLEADPAPTVYAPHPQAASGATHVVLRSDGPVESLQPSVKHALFELNAAMPLSDMRTLSSIVDASVRERRFHLALLTSFAVVAVGLAALGLYGVISHATAERTREIGVRVAVGATSAEVLTMIVRQGATIAGLGIVIGALAAVGLTRLLGGMLFGVTPLDPLTFAAGILLLFATAVAASYWPGRRAAKIDPTVVLRESS